MTRDRNAYFRKHTSLKLRRAFVARQRAKLKLLRRRANCTVISARDSTAPTVTFTATPTSPTNSTSVSFAFTASDASVGVVSGVRRTECSLDNGSYVQCASPQTVSVGEGTHTYAVRAIDNASNTGRPSTFNWTVDTTPPTVGIRSNPSNPTNSTSATFAFTSVDPTSAGVASGVVRSECKLDGGSYAPCSSPQTFSVGEGAHTYQVRAIDAVGNVSDSASRSWTVDTNPPTPTGAVVSGSTLALQFSEAVIGMPLPSSFALRVDSLAWPATSVSVQGNVVTLPLVLAVDGGRTVTVSYTPGAGALTDGAGNPVATFFKRPVTNLSPPPPTPSPEPGYSPLIPKPSWADTHLTDQPPVGEWGPKSDPYWLHSTGTMHGLIVLADFPDAPATTSVDFFKNFFEATAENYYAENSYGRLTLDLTTYPRWVRMSKPAADYGLLGGTSMANMSVFFNELTGLIDADVDFSKVDAIYAVTPESTVGVINTILYRPWPGEGVVRDGKELRWGVVGSGALDPRGPTTNLTAHHIITHETGHLFGLADLYDNAYHNVNPALQFAWAGRWDIMSDNRASSHMFAWNKWLLGWLDPTQLRGLTAPGTTEATLTPLEIPGGLKAVVVPISSTVLYLIEDRQRIGEDSELCDKGVLVWIVDGSRGNVDHNAVVQAASHSYTDACGAIYDAGYDTGPGEVSTFEDSNVKLELLDAYPDGQYRVRVTRK
jgi:M6 family metalloprotease-like protein